MTSGLVLRVKSQRSTNMGHPSLTWTRVCGRRGSVIDLRRRYLGYGVGWSAPARERKGNSSLTCVAFSDIRE
jgi:hypothetical protein